MSGLGRIAGAERLLRGDLASNLVRTFIARALAACGSLVLLFVVGQHLGPSGVGTLALAQSMLLGAGLLAKSGMDNALVRYVGESPTSPNVTGYLFWAIRPAFLYSCAIALLLFLSRSWLENSFSAIGLQDCLWGIALAIPAFTLSYLLSGFFKGVRKPATACLLENSIISLVSGVLIWCFAVYSPSRSIAFDTIGFALFISAVSIFLLGTLQFFLWRRSSVVQHGYSAKQINIKSFKSTSNAFFVANVADFIQAVLAILVAGWLLNTADLGLFKAAQQVGLLIAFILMVINAIFPARFASLYKHHDFSGLSRMAKLGSATGLLFVAPLVALCLFFPGWILSWFGEGFEDAAWLLRIIALWQLVNVATGSVGYLLSMTGHERIMRNVALVCNILGLLGLLGFFVFISLFGVLGAAIALGCVLVMQNVGFLYFVWKKLGIWTLPTPNLFKLMGVPTQALVRV